MSYITEWSSGPIDISDAEEVYSISDEDTPQKEANDRRLAQAINYLQHEGGDDSHATYMARVNRIDETLLDQLPYQGPLFSQRLYRQLRALVISVMRDFEHAAEQDSVYFDSDDELTYIDVPMAHDEEALYRGGDSPSLTPTPAPSKRRLSKALDPRSSEPEDVVQRERSFKYGGDSEIEYWYRDYPASLPFPETLMMAHWESMKIDFDINRPKDAATAETIVPLETTQMQQYFGLPIYESGSRFKLATVSDEDRLAINKLGTKVHLQEIVDKFYESDQTDGGKKDYVPRLFLDRLNVGHQWSPNRLRSKLNASPTRSRPLKTVSSAPPPKLSKPASVSQRGSTPAFRRISQELRRETLVHPATFSTKPQPTPTPPATFSTRPKTATISTLSHVAIPIKKSHGRPPKSPNPVTAPAKASGVSASGPDPVSLKRKPSLGSQPYETPKSSLKKVLRDTKRTKSVGFVEAPIALEEDSEDPNYPATPVHKATRASARMSARGSASKAAVAGKMSKDRKDRASASKAAVAGKMSKARKDSGVGGSRSAGKMTTRSGNAYY